MKKFCQVFILSIFAISAHAHMKLIYSDPMTANDHTSTWKMDEGPQRSFYSKEGLHVQNPYYDVYIDLLQPYMHKGKPLTKDLVRKVLEDAKSLCRSGVGHKDCPYPLPPKSEEDHQSMWLTDIELPDNYTIKYKLRIDSPVAVLVTFISATMKNGDDVLDHNRTGKFPEYKGEYMKNYRLTWGNRYEDADTGLVTTTNQVGFKNPADFLLDSQEHWSNEVYGVWMEWEIVKDQDDITLYISTLDDSRPLERVNLAEHRKGVVWNGGRLGLRGMDVAAWTVSDLRIYEHN